MVVITFLYSETQKKALGFLLGRFSGKVLKNGEHIVPEAVNSTDHLREAASGFTHRIPSL